QPEAYIPQTDTYIEKDADVNEHLDKLRLKATTSLLTRKNTIVVASVSCIYNIGSPQSFADMCLYLKKGANLSRTHITSFLTQIYYERNDVEFTHGKFRVRGAMIDIFPPYSQTALRVELGDGIKSIKEIQPVSGDVLCEIKEAWVYPGKHFVSTREDLEVAMVSIKEELGQRVAELKSQNKLLEAQRLQQRTRYDMEMLNQIGYCSGVENYSRHLARRAPGARPMCLIDYFLERQKKFTGEKGFLLFVDESHVGIPQVRGMYEGDRSRKQTLIDFGFRLPSALDNRPLKFNEFEALMPQSIYVSATPGPYEKNKAQGLVVEQIIRPTGLVDPPVSVHPTEGQIKHLSQKIIERAKKNERTLVLALTKKTAEDLAAYFAEKGIRARYLHSDIDTLKRIEILGDLRRGEFDALVGINLLREGLDIPEVSLVAILGADNEGFLRSETTLVQIAGRAARHIGGEVILYADKYTNSMNAALAEMKRRRIIQEKYNRENKITPKSIERATCKLEEFQLQAKKSGLSVLHTIESTKLDPKSLPRLMENIEKQMRQAADNLDFELAASLRDRLFELREMRVRTTAPARSKNPRK
ncbi:MAG: excinuclease ABC subunit UvrB, partial [Elusimicrobia bacterium]|nr:excinuclease ABC subunit UvrB [Elusimicrobiota bacterium]